MQKKRRYSQSSVRHRRNFPRTLNKFSEQWHNIDVNYHEDRATFICYDDDSPIFGEDNAIKVFDKEVAEIKLIDVHDITEAIESMFEYETYKTALLKTAEHFVMEKVMMDGTLKRASWLFSKGKDETLAKFHLHFEEKTGKQFSEKFINKLYTTIKNKVMFKPIYLDEQGKYLTYFSSQFSDFKPGPTYLNTLIQELQSLYKTYTEHKDTFTLTQAQTYAFYLDKRNEGESFEENSPIAQAWREQYYFLQRSGLERSYLKSLEVLKGYIKPFTTEEGKVVNVQTGSKSFKRNMKLHFFINQENENIDLKRIYVQYHALSEVISLEEQQAIFDTHEMPRFKDLVDFFSPDEERASEILDDVKDEEDESLIPTIENMTMDELIEMQDKLIEILGCEIDDLKNIEEYILMEIVDKYKVGSSLEQIQYVCWFDRDE